MLVSVAMEPNAESAPSPGPPQQAAGPRSRARIVAFVAIWVVVGLVFAEIAARVFVPPRRERILPHQHLGRVRAPGYSPTYIGLLDGKPFVMHIDEHGFRSRMATVG